MGYKEECAKRNKIKYALVERLYLGNFDTYIETNKDGTYSINNRNSTINVDVSGNVNISGASSIKFNSKNLDFNELPDRYIKPSGVSWTWVANHTEVFGVLPIKIKGQKVYIPFINLEV